MVSVSGTSPYFAASGTEKSSGFTASRLMKGLTAALAVSALPLTGARPSPMRASQSTNLLEKTSVHLDELTGPTRGLLKRSKSSSSSRKTKKIKIKKSKKSKISKGSSGVGGANQEPRERKVPMEFTLGGEKIKFDLTSRGTGVFRLKADLTAWDALGKLKDNCNMEHNFLNVDDVVTGNYNIWGLNKEVASVQGTQDFDSSEIEVTSDAAGVARASEIDIYGNDLNAAVATVETKPVSLQECIAQALESAKPNSAHPVASSLTLAAVATFLSLVATL